MTESLFPDLQPIDATPAETVEKLSYGRRLTLRQRADVAAGRHPLLSGLGLRGDTETCGTCAHRVQRGRGNRSWPKCDRYETSGPASDCRAWWPACTGWEPRASPG